MSEPVYGTAEVSAATGATLRQLQWRDEQQFVSVPITGWKREYRFRDALCVHLLNVLAAKDLTFRPAAQALSKLTGDNDLMRCVDSANHILLIGYGSGDVRLTSRALCYDVMLETEEPMIAVDLRAESMRLAKELGNDI